MPGREPGPSVGAGAAAATSTDSLPRRYVAASVVTLVLAAVAAAIGLFVPGFYRDAAPLVPELYGQDLLTLTVAVPALAVSVVYAARGSRRGYVVWLGVTGYLLYTYATYAVMAAFNELYLVYVALFGLTLLTLVGGFGRLDAAALARDVGDRVGAYVAFEVALALLVGALWLADVVPAALSGGVPERVAEAGLPVNAVHTVDLGVVLPAFLLTASLLWRRHPLGYAATAVLLVKAATLGLAVLAMVVFTVRDGQPVVWPQVVIFSAVTLAALALTTRFVRSIDRPTHAAAAPPAVHRRPVE